MGVASVLPGQPEKATLRRGHLSGLEELELESGGNIRPSYFKRRNRSSIYEMPPCDRHNVSHVTYVISLIVPFVGTHLIATS